MPENALNANHTVKPTFSELIAGQCNSPSETIGHQVGFTGDCYNRGRQNWPNGAPMTDVTQILSQIEHGDPHAAEQLLPLVYNELRRLAVQRMSQEKPGHTLQATALVHEAYLRLVDTEKTQHWDSRRHFFAAAAESMRRILIEAARRKRRLKHGGAAIRLDLDNLQVASSERPEFLLALDDALEKLATTNPQAAELIKLRYFSGFTNAEVAALLAVSPRKANQIWAYARAWLLEEIGSGQ